MKLLIVVPSFKILGGVANHYLGLSPFWTQKVYYATYGKRVNIPAFVSFIPDLLIYIIKLIFLNIDIVVVNPSLRNYQLKRDALYLLIAKLFRKKVVTFIHGWDDVNAKKLESNPSFFRKTYGKSCFIYVLCSDFKKSLQKILPNTPIVLTTTKVSDTLIENFDIRQKTGQIKKILFLARVEKSKGIFIVLDAFKEIQKSYSQVVLSVCGSGTSLDEAKLYTQQNNITNVEFWGNLHGHPLIKQFTESDIYVLPTTHGEGMATSVLEAMAFGLPIVTRPVGGVKDFFENGKMGVLTDSLDFNEYAAVINNFIAHPSVVKEIAILNHSYAKDHFLASQVAKKFEDDINKYCTK